MCEKFKKLVNTQLYKTLVVIQSIYNEKNSSDSVYFVTLAFVTLGILALGIMSHFVFWH